jgi:uncharacterized membrane protein SpoIIM required for sporulation
VNLGGSREPAFTERRRADWEALDAIVLRAQSAKRLEKLDPEDVARLPLLYRDVCADLARAVAARYSAALVDYLQSLTSAAHAVVYGARRATWSVGDAVALFPRALRARWRALLLASAFFFVPFALSLAASIHDPHVALRMLPEAQLRQLSDAYAQGFDEGRAGGDNVLMAGFYVQNNVGIALRCFATGIFAGLGSVFFLLYNGIVLGAIMGFVIAQGAGPNLFAFVVGHSTFELGAIVISGAAGLTMGWSIVSPGECTRLASLQRAARDVVVIVGGAAAMLLMAAAIEGFWSGSSAPLPIKWAFGAAMFVLVVLYLTLAGRGKQWT